MNIFFIFLLCAPHAVGQHWYDEDRNVYTPYKEPAGAGHDWFVDRAGRMRIWMVTPVIDTPTTAVATWGAGVTDIVRGSGGLKKILSATPDFAWEPWPDGSITSITATVVNATTINATNITILNATVTNAFITNVTSQNFTTNIFNATTAIINNVTATIVNATSVNITDATIVNVTTQNFFTNVFNATTVNIVNATTQNFFTNILNATDATIVNATFTNIFVENATTNVFNTNILNATTVNITNVTAQNFYTNVLNATEFYITNATVENIYNTTNVTDVLVNIANFLTVNRINEHLASTEPTAGANQVLLATTWQFYTQDAVRAELLDLKVSYDNSVMTSIDPIFYHVSATREISLTLPEWIPGATWAFELTRNAPPWEERRVDVYADYSPRHP